MAELDLTQMREDIDAEIVRATEKERVLQLEIDDIADLLRAQGIWATDLMLR